MIKILRDKDGQMGGIVIHHMGHQAEGDIENHKDHLFPKSELGKHRNK